jgi:hypothetical protein
MVFPCRMNAHSGYNTTTIIIVGIDVGELNVLVR